MEFIQCMPLAQARELIMGSLEGIPVKGETVPLIDALGRITTEDIITVGVSVIITVPLLVFLKPILLLLGTLEVVQL